LVVPAEGELEFLHPLPVERLWGVGKVTAKKLNDRGIFTVADVAKVPDAALLAMLGKATGRHIGALARNVDPRPVTAGRRGGSIGSQHAMGRRPKSADELDAAAVGIVDRVARRMRRASRVGRTVTLRLRFDDFTRITRSHTMPMSTSHTETILSTVRTL